MIVHPRHSWTTTVVKSNAQADPVGSTPVFRQNQVKRINFISPTYPINFDKVDPARIFDVFRAEAMATGLSDIVYNLGVANVPGVWCLRGLHNKSAVSINSDHNSENVSVSVLIGPTEKPTDTLLRAILDARRLVLSRYPGATGIVQHRTNPYLSGIFSNRSFWEPGFYSEVSEDTKDPFPPPALYPGHQSVHVQALQEQLAYWGYYRNRVDGVYTIQTLDAVAALQTDLQELGLLNRDLDGIYSEDVHNAWVALRDSLT